jgi:hypothetical protein
MLSLLFSLRDCFRARAGLQAEIHAHRHQLLILQRSSRGHKLRLSRVVSLGLNLAGVEWQAIGIDHCEARDGHDMAPTRIPALMEIEVSSS